MSVPRGVSPLNYRRLGRHELGQLATLQLEPDQVARFLGPIDTILSAVKRGPAHSLVAINAAETLVGFYVVHPEPRDVSCWWLGWLALDRRRQGCGYGAWALSAALNRLRSLAGCRRVRLLVAPDNLPARTLYERAGFQRIGYQQSTGELLLELPLSSAADSDGNEAFMLQAVIARTRRVFRHRRLRLTVGPHAAWVIGVERGPPAVTRPVHPRRPRAAVTGRPVDRARKATDGTLCSQFRLQHITAMHALRDRCTLQLSSLAD